jgi:hypothetical protein
MAHRSNISDEKAARILVGLRDGKTPRELWTTPDLVKSYCAVHPEYAREALPLMEANIKAAALRKGAHLRNRPHCINGHSLSEHGRVAIRGKGYNNRQCRECERMRNQRGNRMKADVLVRVTARITAGSSITSCTKAGGSRVFSEVLDVGPL